MLYPQPSKYEGKKVMKILFEGLKNADEDDLLYVMKTTVGYPLKALELREDIKKIFKKGNFESIVVEVEEYMDGVRLRFVCKERPVVKEIAFKGLDEVSESDLTSAIPIKEGAVIRKDYLEKSVAAIRKKYEDEGLFNAVIRYEVKPVRGDESNVSVIFIIDEGEEIRVRKLTVLGAKKLGTRGAALASWRPRKRACSRTATSSARYGSRTRPSSSPITARTGYLDAQILEESVEYEWVNPEKKDKRGIFLTLKVSEGEHILFRQVLGQDIEGKRARDRFSRPRSS